MDAKPSYRTSTLSQAFIGSLEFYGLLLLIVTVGLVWANLNVETAKMIIGWASAIQASVMSAYLTARKTNGGSNGVVAEPPKHD